MCIRDRVQRGQRVFPRSEKASDVIRALARLMEQAGVRVRLHSRIQSLIVQEGRAAGVVLENGERLEADAVILAPVSYTHLLRRLPPAPACLAGAGQPPADGGAAL